MISILNGCSVLVAMCQTKLIKKNAFFDVVFILFTSHNTANDNKGKRTFEFKILSPNLPNPKASKTSYLSWEKKSYFSILIIVVT